MIEATNSVPENPPVIRTENTIRKGARRSYASPLKMAAIRKDHFTGPRRKRPAINALKTAQKRLLARDKLLASSLMMDAHTRSAILHRIGRPPEPMSVWNKIDHPDDQPYAPAHSLPQWDNLTEAMKMFIAWDVGMEFGVGITFTAHIDPGMVERWSASDTLPRNVEQRLRRAMQAQGIGELPICYVLEARSQTGKSATRPHLHGFALCDEITDATRLKVALEEAFHPNRKRSRRTREIQVKRARVENPPLLSRTLYPFYISKHANSYDARFGKRRSMMSRSMKGIAFEAWMTRCER